MIESFNCKETKKIFEGVRSSKLPADIQRQARRKLIQIDSARSVADLRVPPSNHLEALKGDRKSQYSIRINIQWRICFTPVEGGFADVEIVDYH